jgi:hypothetical protein
VMEAKAAAKDTPELINVLPVVPTFEMSQLL